VGNNSGLQVLHLPGKAIGQAGNGDQAVEVSARQRTERLG
jgi:hypothetical protein